MALSGHVREMKMAESTPSIPVYSRDSGNDGVGLPSIFIARRLLYGVAESSGEVNWELPVGGPVSAVTAVDETSILVATEAGVVQRIR